MFNKGFIINYLLFVVILWLSSISFSFSNYFLQNDEISLVLVWLHRWISVENIDNVYINDEWSLWLLKKMKNYSEMSIVSMLEFSAMKEVVLDKYLSEISNILKISWFMINDIKQNILLLESKMDSCLNDKKLYDKQFFDAIELYDQKYMEESLSKSIESQKCASENRIKMNADIVVFDSLVYYSTFLKKKYDYVLSQRDLIIRNFDFIKNGMLDEIVQTKRVLNSLWN